MFFSSVMVEDGSCNALVHCDGDVVFKLLALTAEQTDALKSLVATEGEIILDKVLMKNEFRLSDYAYEKSI